MIIMIDSLNFTILKQIKLDIIPNRTFKVHDSSGTILYYSGKIGPLTVIVKPYNNTTKISGSIRKYYLGETELRDLTFAELSTAVNKLRQDLQLSHAKFSEAIITRIDVGSTIPIEGNINDYFNAIVSYPRPEKITYDDSIEFRGSIGSVSVLKKYGPFAQLMVENVPDTTVPPPISMVINPFALVVGV